MRFKCVSKWWHDLITSPRFVAKHLSIAKQNGPSTCILFKRLVCKDAETEKPGIIFSFLNFTYESDNDGGGELSTNLSSVEDLTILNRLVESLSIIGHCDGIVCLALFDTNSPAPAKASEVCLWNPAIQEFKFLPEEPFLHDWSKVPPSSIEENPYLRPICHFSESMGFGYDARSKDYKVIDIGFSGSKYYGDPEYYGGHVIVYPPKAVVYSLRSDSWREIKTLSLERETSYLWPNIFQLYFKGMFYWSGYETQKEFVTVFETQQDENERIGQAIISFDTSDEVFHEVLLPYELLEVNGPVPRLHLTVWNESVALFGSNLGSITVEWHKAKATMWVMNDCANTKAAWTKHLTFEYEEFFPDRFPRRVLAFWKSNEILGVGENGILVCYNLITKTVRYLPIQSVPHSLPFISGYFFYPFCGTDYVHSVVPIMNHVRRHI
uniref:uncharacterized protein LOC101314201 n=1 Tax=Fragaria vesca subsp. vesca TaxID=101020 RepID=UPI0005C87997|nr:PREDICTED: uncharacterized protein LOC101314201 [Fragaria vesca subsp. vesca]XP_011466187.1 PREDICTED: uncharacterized protein LOC101314201 [Fragaria vesca subsp. vesca]